MMEKNRMDNIIKSNQVSLFVLCAEDFVRTKKADKFRCAPDFHLSKISMAAS